MNAPQTDAVDRLEKSARDPVCGASVAISEDARWSEYVEVIYYFCSQNCLERFIQDADIFTTDSPVGTLATHDRGLRTVPQATTDQGPMVFEQSHT